MIDSSDFGLAAEGKGVKIVMAKGSLAVDKDRLLISSLSGQFNNTHLALSGNVYDMSSTPRIDLSVTSPHLEINDLVTLASIEPEPPPSSPPSPLSLRAQVSATTANVRDITLEQLKGVVLLENNILYLQQVEAVLAGGKLSGNARIDVGSSGTSRRKQAGFKLEGASAERFVRAMGVDSQEIKGTLSLQGDLTAKGETIGDIKQTALGTMTLSIDKGSLRRFPVLSKIFSILNLSQLLEFRLPDMVSGGMPFDKITGTFSFRDGIISTSDLYVDSDAINMSAVGSLNLPRDEINATIGVKPLQTIDKVVSRIPIVGWILTGKDKTLLTAYFEAKGKIGNPEVNAIPVKGMAKGVLDIFRRIFELPARLVTDTGEVIIGK
jgi:hypothetical protein